PVPLARGLQGPVALAELGARHPAFRPRALLRRAPDDATGPAARLRAFLDERLPAAVHHRPGGVGGGVLLARQIRQTRRDYLRLRRATAVLTTQPLRPSAAWAAA